MSKFCANCGQEVPEGTNYCTKCGASLNTEQTNTNNGSTVIINNYNNNSNLKLPNRNIALAVIFSILTCGIYGIYWAYKMGQKLHTAGEKHNKPIGDNSILYLILSIFGLGIVNYCLMQNDLNRFSE